MPLRLKCKHCARELLLDEAFAGAGCRCQHCRHFMRVPNDSSVVRTRSASRPAHPPLAAARPSRAAISTGSSVAPASAARPASRWRVLRSPAALASIAVSLVAFSSLGVWSLSKPPRDRIVDRARVSEVSMGVSQFAASHNDAADSATTSAGLRYFGLPLSGSTIAYVVDTDPAITPYFSNVSSITNAVNNRLLQGGPQRFAVFYPGMARKSSLLEMAENKNVLEDGEAVLASRLPPPGGSLSESLARVGGSFADEVFLVLGHALTPAEIDVLTQSAEQTGAVTHVIAVGPAARQDLSPIARATGGTFVSVDDATMAAQLAQAGVPARPAP